MGGHRRCTLYWKDSRQIGERGISTSEELFPCSSLCARPQSGRCSCSSRWIKCDRSNWILGCQVAALNHWRQRDPSSTDNIAISVHHDLMSINPSVWLINCGAFKSKTDKIDRKPTKYRLDLYMQNNSRTNKWKALLFRELHRLASFQTWAGLQIQKPLNEGKARYVQGRYGILQCWKLPY